MAFARLHPNVSPLPINIDIRLCSHNCIYKAIMQHASHAMSFTADLQTKDLKKKSLSKNCSSWNGPDLKGNAKGSTEIHPSLQKKKIGGICSTSGKESACQCIRHKRQGFDPWVRKIPWRRVWQLTQVFLATESHGERNLVGSQSTGWQRVRYHWSNLACMHMGEDTGLSLKNGFYSRVQVSLLSSLGFRISEMCVHAQGEWLGPLLFL